MPLPALLLAALLLQASEPPGDGASLVPVAVEALIGMQEGPGRAEWPYEGVYRVEGEIPIGYRVGGTSLVAMSLLQAPGWEEDVARREAVMRALDFVLDATAHEEMAHEFEARYDVRGWGYACAVNFLARLQLGGHLPDDRAEGVGQAMAFYLDGLTATEIPTLGGWNYSRPGGFGAPSPPSSFMTATTLQALFEASAAGHPVDPRVVRRALNVLEAARAADGAIQYRTGFDDEPRSALPGATGRMLAAESTLLLAGRSSPDRVHTALEAFAEHWHLLDARRAQPGTHMKPYGIAPYYVFYAHHQAAIAIELLPEDDRPAWRGRLRELLLKTRLESGTWNDRVFERTANYGTAMAVLALTMPPDGTLVRWTDVSDATR